MSQSIKSKFYGLSGYALSLLIVFLLVVSPARAESVCQVVDGDTIKLCKGQSVHLHGIDAPELHQPLGHESREHLTGLVKGKDVRLHYRGRFFMYKVCQVWVDGKDVSDEMVTQGWAFDYPEASKDAYAKAQAHAQAHHLGVWKIPNGGERPWDWRYEQRVHSAHRSHKKY